MSSDRPTRTTSDGRAYLDLQSLARKTGRSTDELMRLYALEGLLARLAASRHAAQLVLKGGVLLAAYGTRRATRDIDLQARQVANDLGNVLRMIQEIAEITIDDGLAYAAKAATAHAIRQDDAYHGVRVSLTCSLVSARISLHVDVNVGDPIWPAPQAITLPGLLGRDVTLTGYPLTMICAEKIVTAVERGPATTRWRDFADIYALSAQHRVHGHELVGSIERVAEFRGIPPRPLSDVLRDWQRTPPRIWVTWRRLQLLDSVPQDFSEVLSGVIAFADPALTRDAVHATWDPLSRLWVDFGRKR
jgi:predicted nucleotidyltransferase component of viral defense system